MAAKTDNYEKNIKELEELVSKLEEGGMDLKKSMELFEKGIKLSAQCTKLLDNAQERMDVLFEEAGMGGPKGEDNEL